MNCPLCCSEQTQFYYQDKKRPYQQCLVCDLVFVPTEYHLTAEQEKAEYDKHDNNQLDEGYQRFLSRTFEPLKKFITPQQVGLDFGCGEGAVLSHIAAQQGYQVVNYDLYYHPNAERLTQSYHYIILTEVIEHIALPHQLLPKLINILLPGGILAVMTKRVINLPAFTKWHYKNDPTHICYYSDTSCNWIAQAFKLDVLFIEKDVVFFKKK
ncbi:class I SAM-dependent methyltransferase [Catenovulum sediminis]|uniref:Class I SAM-dependent methyltransferase n=1 Tax=Catenovulum sediminis TaxID=1740262 RepID=A0ABV1RF84_9ALTE|nr:class I SAM-dependent methyltransferase [Catenovulum sediminis]